MICMKKAPIASQTAVVENAQSGCTASDRSDAIMIMRRRPKRSDSVPNEMPPMMAPIL